MLIEMLKYDPRTYVAIVITLVLSICLHELGHGFMAIFLGDRTPIEQERITLSPLVHMGGMSLIMLFVVGIAWGSMPIDPRRIRGKYGPALVAFAGPLVNIFLALAALVALGLWMRSARFGESEISQTVENGRLLLLVFGSTNIMLAMFNLLPVPPLDGSRILANLIPSYGRAIEALGSQATIAFLFVFFFVSKYMWPVADQLAGRILDFVRG